MSNTSLTPNTFINAKHVDKNDALTFLRTKPRQTQSIKVQNAWKNLGMDHMDDELKESRTINKQTHT